MYLMHDQPREYGLKFEGHTRRGLFILVTGKLKAEKDSGMSQFMQQVLSLLLSSSVSWMCVDRHFQTKELE